MLKRVFWGLGALLLAGAVFLAWQAWVIVYGRPARVDVMGARQFVQYLASDPETLSELGFVDGSLLDFHSDDLSEHGQQGIARKAAAVRRYRRELARYDRDRLSPEQALTFKVWSWWLDAEIAVSEPDWAAPLSQGPYIVDQFGLHSSFVQLMTQSHGLGNAKLARNYLARLGKFGEAADQTIAAFEAHAAAGVLAPRSVLERTLAGIDLFLAPPPAENVLVVRLRERLQQQETFSPEAVAEQTAKAEAAVAEAVYPGMGRLRAAIAAKLGQARTQRPGLIGLPGGAEHYRARLRQQTSAEADPEALHQLGLAESARLGGELARRLDGLGYTGGTLPERLQRLRAATLLNLTNDEAGRQEVLRQANALRDAAAAAAPGYFNRLPASPVEIRLEPAHTAATGAPSSYSPPAADGSRPGVFSLSAKDVSTITRLGLPSLVHHETIPGHHYQLALQQERGLPLLRQYLPFGAFTEGWAIYAESLAVEMGLYQGDPLAELGQLASDLSGAVVLALDTGLHHKGWSREEGLAFLGAYLHEAEPDQFKTAVDRSLAWPGQMLSYGAGYQKIKELRARAEQRLGAKFDIKAFHDAVLEAGAMPLAILEQRIETWIAAEAGRA